MMKKNPFINGTHIMGIVNVTSDSFSDGGKFYKHENAISHARQLLMDGADIIDIGGESTRPGAEPVSIDEELSRVIPVIEVLKNETQWISIDTRHAIVMDEAIKVGATMINDVSALEDDIDSLSVIKKYNVPVCLMHKKGSPKTMQDNAEYEDVVLQVYGYLQSRISFCINNGIDVNRLIIDVGIGFGKTLGHNLLLLKNLQKFHQLNVPVLLGASRKSFIEHASEDSPSPCERLGGSLSAALWGMERGAQILRVHDVYETKQAVNIRQSILNV